MIIGTIEFVELEKKLQKTNSCYLDILAPDLGKAYVIAISRDHCPSCKQQKPRLDKLATKVVQKHGDRVVFTRIHIRYTEGSSEESLRSKDVFRHYFYPTNLILVKTRDRGVFEYYRNAAPEMNELGRNIEVALETAVMLAKDTN